MRMRQRKLFGGLGLVLGLTLYVLAVSIVTTALFPTNLLAQTAVYAVAGVAWAFPVRGLIIWMNRPDPED